MRGFLDNLRLAFGTFIANPLRTLLTLLGIVIGVATVISMMSLIEGLRVKMNEDFSSLGADVLQATKWPVGFNRHGSSWRKYAKRKNLTLEDREALALSCPSVLRVAGHTGTWGERVRTSFFETNPNVRVVGATPEYAETSSSSVASGRFFGDSDDLEGRAGAVIGVDVADLLFPGSDPVGQELRIKDRPFHVIGVLQKKGSALGAMALDNVVYMPLRSFLQLYGTERSLELTVQASEPALLARAQDEVTLALRRRRGLRPVDANDFEIFTNDSVTRSFNSLSQVITAAAFGVCLLSLMVGGIGILNIMLVSVTERTKEIGIRKALGAKRRRILGQFATEAIALSAAGGVLGIAVGFGLAFLGRWVADLPIVVPTWAVVLGLVMSSGVGLVFGIYPASRAAKLDPVEAMRSE
jgi:putative ABC transport system permease protein